MCDESQHHKNEILEITDDIFSDYYNFINAITFLWIQSLN